MVWALVACAALVSARLASELLKHQPFALDFLPMWTGGGLARAHPAQLYDFAAITRAETWLLGPDRPQRVFPYPPSALLLFAPLAVLPFWPAAGLWLAGTGGAFVAASARLLKHRPWTCAAVVASAPTVVWAAVSGQGRFLIGALVIAALAGLGPRPWLAGALLGVAAAIKPSLLVMAPVALVAAGQWRAMGGAVVAGVAMFAAALAAFGVGPWLDWARALPRFVDQMNADPGFADGVITPSGLAVRLGATGLGLTLVRGVSLLGALAVVLLTFRRSGDLALRLSALVGGGLLATPYAMNYDAALLVPAAAALLARSGEGGGDGRLRALIGCAGLIVAAVPGICPLGLAVFLGAALVPVLRGDAPARL